MLTQPWQFFPTTQGRICQIGGTLHSARLNEEELTELMRLAEPDPDGNVAVPWRGKGHVIFVDAENGGKLGKADCFCWEGRGYASLR